ncbi:MAG TPA: MerR family transcriptional regulator [Candidatus Omnitrophota bacterium]|nr:MerR family transcriptional regulator [Candidatus Omnitrophota bacterium]
MDNQFTISRSVADKLGIGIFKYSLSPTARFVNVNEAFVVMLGLSSSKKLSEKRITCLFSHSQSAEEFLEILKKQGKVRFFQTSYKNKKGDRFFTKKDIETIRTIYYLTKVKGYTLQGAKDALKGNFIKESSSAQVVDTLLKVKKMLLDIKEEL